jgi:UDP-N-acetylglucosamine--N-acetylmuramyl-(pentapeptide) pyrophosphoryl-undecaprenol N-acetylglucosamine transferase
VLPRYPYRHYLLPLEPLYRAQWWRNARWTLALPRLWGALRRVFAAETPVLVVGTGGYAAGPVVWWARRMGLPTALQEQNSFPGLVTRWLAGGARQVHLGFPEARARLRPGPATAVFDFGNPIRPPAPGDAAAARVELGLDPARPPVLVFGGRPGARPRTAALARALEDGALREAGIVWGPGVAHADALARFAEPGRVVVRGFLDPMTTAYRAADIVVCRAGAMTTAELCAWGKAGILVPLPSAAADHQTHNARALSDAGAAVLLPERDLSATRLAGAVTGLLTDPDRLTALARAAASRGRPNAARDVVSKILTLIH